MPQTQRQTDRGQTDRAPVPQTPPNKVGPHPKPANENSRIDASEFWRRLGL